MRKFISSDEENQPSECFICRKSGILMRCECCCKTYHTECILRAYSTRALSMWICPVCGVNEFNDMFEEVKDQYLSFCRYFRILLIIDLSKDKEDCFEGSSDYCTPTPSWRSTFAQYSGLQSSYTILRTHILSSPFYDVYYSYYVFSDK